MAVTDSLTACYKVLRDRLLSFTPAVGASLQTRLSGRLAVVQAPDSTLASAAYGIIRLVNVIPDAETVGLKLHADLEVMLYGRPRAAQQAVSGAADVVVQACYAWLAAGTAAQGFLYTGTPRRDDLPPFTSPADRELVQIRVMAPVVLWPQLLMQYAG